jgi:isoleucyl-tRNA synthetase
VRLDDLHRPAVDALVRPNPDDPTGQSMMRRVEDVLDCWFESGSMPFAQVHYPFENKDWFEDHFPADFICEYIGQTRGWFYTMHVLACALFDRPAFANCVVHGVLLGDDGRKLSKRLANYPDPVEVFDTIGSDAMRWALLSSAGLRGQDLTIDRKTMAEPVRQVLNPIWNAWYFFSLYANTEGYAARWRVDAPGVLDRYVLAKLRGLVEDVTDRMDAYDLSGACSSVVAFLDALNNWYIRRSRDRFWEGDRDAFDTLYTVLEVLLRVVAPLLPLTADGVYRGLVADARSVHVTDWPSTFDLPADDELVASMDRVREACSAALSVRKEGGWRVRLPLSSLSVIGPGAGALAPFVDLIADEVNVKEVRLTDELGDAASWVLALNMPVLGPRLGPDTQKIVRAVKEGRWSQAADGTVSVGDRVLAPEEYRLALTPADPHAARALPGDQGLVVLDVTVTPELEAEGLARDVVRLVQVARRDAGLHVSDRIHLVIDPGDHADVRDAVESWRDWVMHETLAAELVVAGPLSDPHRGELPDGRAIHIGLSKLV